MCQLNFWFQRIPGMTNQSIDEVKEKLVQLFQNNFKEFEAGVNLDILAAGPKLPNLLNS